MRRHWAALSSGLVMCAVVASVVLSAPQAWGAVSRPKVRFVVGQPQYKPDAMAKWAALKADMALPAGAIIKTDKDSKVELWFGVIGSVIHVEESTELVLQKLDYTIKNNAKIIAVELDLKAGTILGNVMRLDAESRYDVIIPNGVCSIRGTEFRISANGIVSVFKGLVKVTYAVQDGKKVITEVTGGKTCFPPKSFDGAPRLETIPQLSSPQPTTKP